MGAGGVWRVACKLMGLDVVGSAVRTGVAAGGRDTGAGLGT